MNKLELIKKLLPGLAPLLIFVIADGIWGTEIGLIVAIVFGLVEVLISVLNKKRPDKFILFDVGLLVVMGGVSLWLENELFFKLKPGVIGLILCVVLGFSAYGKQNVLMTMSGRYLKGVEINPWQQYEFLQSIKNLFWMFSAHTIWVFISAALMSKEMWVLISGPGFYALFGIYFGWEIIHKKKNQKRYQQEEWLPVLNDEGNVIGKMPRSVAHNGSKILHPVVHMQVLNSKGELYLQKRAANKLVQPNKWDTAVGGHVASEETIELSLQRESLEEIGLSNFSARPFKQYVWESEIEKEMVFGFVSITDDPLNPDPKEVSEGKFWKISEIENNLGKDIFTPNFKYELPFLKLFLEENNFKFQ